MSFELKELNYLLEEENYAEKLKQACFNYLWAFLKDPSNLQLKEKLTLLLSEWEKSMLKTNDDSDLTDWYEILFHYFPDDVILLNNFGSHLVRLNHSKKAVSYFQKCLTINPGFLRAVRNLDNVLISSVERWNFKMLNDQDRNEAFRKAIIKKINQGFDRVLDVGTGTGLLSLCCLDGKAKEVYACDVSSTMIEIAKEVFHSNSASAIKLIEKHSLKLQVPEDIGEKVSLLVTETFDVGLLGENVLLILEHAWKNLLLPPQGQAEGLNSDKFGAVIPHRAVVYVTGIEFDDVANCLHLKQMGDSYLFEDCCVVQNCLHYDSQDLSRAQFKCLTGTEKLFEINFNDPGVIEEFLKGWRKEMNLKCKHSGRLDCFAVWFDLYVDEDIVLNTSPLIKPNGAWDQAVFFLPRSTLVKEEDDLKISVLVEQSLIKAKFCGDNIGSDNPVFMASEDTIRIINDENLTKALYHTATKLTTSFSHSVRVLDLCEFPIFGLHFLKRRSERFQDVLFCIARTRNDERLINFMAEKYGLKIDCMYKSPHSSLPNFFSMGTFDVILLDLVERSGEIKDEILLAMDDIMSVLSPRGIILPEKVEVIGQFIHSNHLTKLSKVINDSVTCGYKIAEHINKYQTEEFIEFYLKSLCDNIAFSAPFKLFNLFDPLESVTEMIIPSLSADAFTNAMVYWFKIKFTEDCEEVATKDLIFYHQAAFVFSEVKRKDIKFNIIRNDGLFRIKLLDN